MLLMKFGINQQKWVWLFCHTSSISKNRFQSTWDLVIKTYTITNASYVEYLYLNCWKCVMGDDLCKKNSQLQNLLKRQETIPVFQPQTSRSWLWLINWKPRMWELSIWRKNLRKGYWWLINSDLISHSFTSVFQHLSVCISGPNMQYKETSRDSCWHCRFPFSIKSKTLLANASIVFE